MAKPYSRTMFAVGHLALGYILGRTTSKSLEVNLNIPLVLTASIMPDIDLVMQELIPALKHRGPTHSVILILFLFLPVFILYRERAAPYFVAAAQHSILGDFITGGGVQLLWPLDSSWFGIGMEMMSSLNIFIEWILFLAFLTVMFRTRDLSILFQPHTSNMLLVIPILTVLLPTLLSFPLAVPSELIIPHVVYLALFAVSILTDFQNTLRKSLQ